MKISLILFLVIKIVFSYAINNKRIFCLLYDYLGNIMAYDFDENYISLINNEKMGYVLATSNFDTKYKQDLSTLDPFASTNISSIQYKSYFKYPNGMFALNSVFYLFNITKSHIGTFIDTTIDDIDFLDNENVLVFHNNKQLNFTTFTSLINLDFAQKNYSALDIQIKDFFVECPIILISYFNKEAFAREYYILHVLTKKTLKIKENAEFLLKYIEETIDKSFSTCSSDSPLEFEMDFELGWNYFLISCNDYMFIFSFASAYNQSFEINRIYYRNPIERMLINSISLKIIDEISGQLFYSIFSEDSACYYIFEHSRESFKYFINKRILCMSNSVMNAKIENIHYNKANSFITLIMKNETDSTFFFPSFHRCVLNMHTNNFVCQICNTFYCPKQCERYQYPGCNYVGEVQRTFFAVLTMMILMSIIFLCCAHICKNRESTCVLICSFFKCIFLLVIKSALLIKNCLWNKRCLRKLTNARSYLIYWFKCGWRKLEEEKTCPICLESINLRPKMFFACGRHEAHVDCFNHYTDTNLENNKKEGCPFRDA